MKLVRLTVRCWRPEYDLLNRRAVRLGHLSLAEWVRTILSREIDDEKKKV